MKKPKRATNLNITIDADAKRKLKELFPAQEMSFHMRILVNILVESLDIDETIFFFQKYLREIRRSNQVD